MTAAALRRRIVIAAILVLTPLATFARTTIVPDDFPTIQAAIDHIGESAVAETVLVRPGDYPEGVVVQHRLVIRGTGTTPETEPAVRISGLLAHRHPEFESIGQIYEGLRIDGTVSIGYKVDALFRDCHFGADLTTEVGELGNPEYAQIAIRRCVVSGSTSMTAEVLHMDSTVFHGPVRLNAWYEANVRDNHIKQTHGAALTVSSEVAGSILRNCIRGGTLGILAQAHDGFHVNDNIVEGCSGDGIYVNGRESTVERNLVTNCAGVGIRTGDATVARGNRVLDCSGSGLDLNLYDTDVVVEGNVAGRCGNNGIVLSQSTTGNRSLTVQSNTAFACKGNGIVLMLEEPPANPLIRNLSCFNVGAGIAIARGKPMDLSCNDWFANGGGASVGVGPAASDLAIDPQLCDGVNGDGSLLPDSPLLDATGCGRIGALGQGCESPPVAIGFAVSPRVLPPASRGRWITAWLEPGSPFTAADIEIATVRLNDIPAASSEGVVGDRDGDGLPDLELRFDRIALGRTLSEGQEVTLTVTGLMRGRLFTGTDQIRVPPAHGVGRSGVPRAGLERVLSIHAPVAGGVVTGLRVAFTLADESPAYLEMLDVAGRVVLTREVSGRETGEQSLDLGREGFAQGIYFLRLRQGVSEARTRMVFVR